MTSGFTNNNKKGWECKNLRMSWKKLEKQRGSLYEGGRERNKSRTCKRNKRSNKRFVCCVCQRVSERERERERVIKRENASPKGLISLISQH